MKKYKSPNLIYVVTLCCALVSLCLWPMIHICPEAEIRIIEAPVEVPMSVQATQLRLIALGYKRVYVPEQGDFNEVVPDGVWGDITDAAYAEYKADRVWPKEK